jgi:hypothetical protein
MKVTYSIALGNDLTKSNLSTRALTENLMSNDKIDVHFSNFPFLASYRASKEIRDMVLPDRSMPYKANFRTMMMMVLTQKYKEDFLDSIKGDYLLYSMCCGTFDYELIAYLLNQGVRVVLGGSEINMTPFDEIKNRLRFCGAKNLDNVIFVNGFVKTYTDLYTIIKKWENTYLDRRDLENLLYPRKDYTIGTSISNIVKKIDYSTSEWPIMIFVLLNSICNWKKCTFCRYDEVNAYIGRIEWEEIYDAFMKICDHLDIHYISFGDSYFYLNEKRLNLIKKLKESNIKLHCQTGVRLLQNKEYAKNICKYFNLVSVGVETFTDFSLQQFNKGYTWQEIWDTFDYIKNYGQNTRFIVNQLMDAPTSDEEDVKLNYERMLRLKQHVESYGTMILYSPRMLSMLTKKIFDAFVSLGHVREPKENLISGRYVIWNELEKVKDIPQVYKLDGIPYERIGTNGQLIKSDIDIIDHSLYADLVKGWNPKW